MRSYDVVVIGAGLAGLSCARDLATKGLSVALVDRKKRVCSGVRTTGIFVRKTLEDFSFPENTLGPALNGVKLFSPAGACLELKSKHTEFRVGRMEALYAFGEQACRSAGVDLLLETHFLGLEPDLQGSILLLKKKGSEYFLRTTVVVGADGARSRVATALGLSRNKKFLLGVEEVYSTPANCPKPPAMYCYLEPKLAPGYLAWVCQDGEDIHLGLAGRSGAFAPRASLSLFRAKVAAEFGLEACGPKERRGGPIPVGGVLPHISCRAGLLVGDAAGAVSPLTAGGLDPCLRQSRQAAGVISAALLGGDLRLLETYKGRRYRRRFISRLWMRRIFDLNMPSWLLEWGHRLARRGPFKKLAWHVFFGRNSFPNLDPVALFRDRRKKSLDHFR